MKCNRATLARSWLLAISTSTSDFITQRTGVSNTVIIHIPAISAQRSNCRCAVYEII
jgi:hypothetical protein